MRQPAIYLVKLCISGMLLAAIAWAQTGDDYRIDTFAGGGDGDGGPAVQAALYSPAGVAVDGAGNVYVTDDRNHRIRKVDAAGVITTIAGTGETGYREGGFSGDGGPATEAALYYPRGVAVDGAGNVYVEDAGNHRVRRIDTAWRRDHDFRRHGGGRLQWGRRPGDRGCFVLPK